MPDVQQAPSGEQGHLGMRAAQDLAAVSTRGPLCGLKIGLTSWQNLLSKGARDTLISVVAKQESRRDSGATYLVSKPSLSLPNCSTQFSQL